MARPACPADAADNLSLPRGVWWLELAPWSSRVVERRLAPGWGSVTTRPRRVGGPLCQRLVDHLAAPALLLWTTASSGGVLRRVCRRCWAPVHLTILATRANAAVTGEVTASAALSAVPDSRIPSGPAGEACGCHRPGGLSARFELTADTLPRWPIPRGWTGSRWRPSWRRPHASLTPEHLDALLGGPVRCWHGSRTASTHKTLRAAIDGATGAREPRRSFSAGCRCCRGVPRRCGGVCADYADVLLKGPRWPTSPCSSRGDRVREPVGDNRDSRGPSGRAGELAGLRRNRDGPGAKRPRTTVVAAPGRPPGLRAGNSARSGWEGPRRRRDTRCGGAACSVLVSRAQSADGRGVGAHCSPGQGRRRLPGQRPGRLGRAAMEQGDAVSALAFTVEPAVVRAARRPARRRRGPPRHGPHRRVARPPRRRPGDARGRGAGRSCRKGRTADRTRPQPSRQRHLPPGRSSVGAPEFRAGQGRYAVGSASADHEIYSRRALKDGLSFQLSHATHNTD